MSSVRTHFWLEAMRRFGGVCSPIRYGMNGTMPAMVNSVVGFGEISDAEGMTRWSCLEK